LIVFAIVVWDLGNHGFPGLGVGGRTWLPWVAAVITTFLFFGSVLLHELSHSFVAKRMGIGVSRITLFIFGGVAQVEAEPKTPKEELLISLAGPAMSVLLALVFGAGYWALVRYLGAGLVTRCLERVAIVNLILAVFNMIPGFPLDGGRVARALLWYSWGDRLRATRVASVLGQVVGYGLAALGVGLGIMSASLWLIIFYAGMGMLLASVARVTYQRERAQVSLNAVPLWQLTVQPEMSFPKGTPLGTAAPYYLSRGPHGWVPVLDGHQPVGVVSPSLLRQIPPWQWQQLRVEDVMEPLREDMVIRQNSPAFEALERMSEQSRSSIIVVDDWGNFGGIVTQTSVRAALAALIG